MRRLIDENQVMRTLRFLPLVLAAGLAVSTSAAAQSLPRFGAPEPHVKAELIAASDAVVAGQPLQVGVRLTHDDEWHTYWQVPGDSGLPTQINWSLPAAMVAGPIEWPHPHRLPTGPLVNFGYEGDTLLLTTLQVPANLTGQAITLNAKAEWLECKDVCIPGSADLKLTLPVKGKAAPSAHAARFAEARKLVPAALPGLDARGTVDANRIRVAFELPAGRTADKLEFFPLEEGRIEPAARTGARPRQWARTHSGRSEIRQGRCEDARRRDRRQRRPCEVGRLDRDRSMRRSSQVQFQQRPRVRPRRPRRRPRRCRCSPPSAPHSSAD